MFIRLSSEYNMSAYTLVDNVFIHEFLPSCPDNYLKVYLFGLYAASSSGSENTLDSFCVQLKLTEEEIFEAFVYFEEYSLVSVLSKNPLTVTFCPVSGLLAKPRKIKPQKYSEFTKQIQMLLPQRMITTAEYSEYFHLIESYKIQQEALVLIIQHCTIVKDKSISYKYISAVAKNWAVRGITTYAAAESELAAYHSRSSEIGEIYKAMGLKEGVDLLDSELFNKWTKELGFEKSAILFAAKKLKSKRPSMQKLNEQLLEYFRNKKFSKEEISEFDEQKTVLREIALSVSKALGVYTSDLTPVTETYITPWTDAGFERETLQKIASYCFKFGIKTLAGMDAFVGKLLKQGVITDKALSEYIAEQIEREKVLKAVLKASGLDREVNSYDRNNYHIWSGLWGISDDLILFAAEKSVGLSPIKNMHRLISLYKQKNIFTVTEAEKITLEGQVVYNKPKSSFDNYPQREYTKEELSGLFDDIEQMDKL